MAIEFRGVRFPPLRDLTVSAPSGAVIGIIGEKGAGKAALLRLASGAIKPEAGEVIAPGESRYLGPSDALQLSPVDVLLMEHSLAQHDALVRARALAGIGRLRSGGSTVLPPLLSRPMPASARARTRASCCASECSSKRMSTGESWSASEGPT